MARRAPGFRIGGAARPHLARRRFVLDRSRPDPHLRGRSSRPAGAHQPTLGAAARRLATDRRGGCRNTGPGVASRAKTRPMGGTTMTTLDDILEPGPAERLATGFVFTEGPSWHPDGFYYFVDIRRSLL